MPNFLTKSKSVMPATIAADAILDENNVVVTPAVVAKEEEIVWKVIGSSNAKTLQDLVFTIRPVIRRGEGTSDPQKSAKTVYDSFSVGLTKGKNPKDEFYFWNYQADAGLVDDNYQYMLTRQEIIDYAALVMAIDVLVHGSSYIWKEHAKIVPANATSKKTSDKGGLEDE